MWPRGLTSEEMHRVSDHLTNFYRVLPELAIISAGGCGAGGCDVCKGDCDYDADCKSGLSCFQRDGGEMVPGCSGDGVGGYDYCIAP